MTFSGKTFIQFPAKLLQTKSYDGNKAKGRISKRVFQENKACQIFRKTKIWRALFS